MWNIIAHPDRSHLFLEIRDSLRKAAHFSCLDPETGSLIWQKVDFEEKWWISLADASGDILFFTVFNDAQNPDRKSIVAYNYVSKAIAWWRNNFAISSVGQGYIRGNDLGSRPGEVVLDISNGNEVQIPVDFTLVRNFSVLKPLQYHAGTIHFDTVSDFLKSRRGFSAADLIEYLEYESFFIVSFYLERDGLANFLIVFDNAGRTCFETQIASGAHGIGMDTFFVFAGHLIFVRNKSELVSIKLS